jgi:hypothetical protein
MSGDASSVMHLVCARKTSEKSSSLGDFQQDLALSSGSCKIRTVGTVDCSE